VRQSSASWCSWYSVGAAIALAPHDERRRRISTRRRENLRAILVHQTGGVRDESVAVVRRVLELAGAMDVETLAELLADDIVMELPYAPAGYAARHDGKTAVMRFQRAAAREFSSFSMVVDRVLATTEPRVVVAEHHSDGVAARTGRRYQNRYATIFELDADRRIRRWTEYYDPAAVIAAFGAG
jgi:ketosteroid isomerase-like protein